MNSGYLYLQTHADHPGLVRFLTRETLPSQVCEPPLAVRYIARFNDVETALMHVQNALRRNLIDIDEHLYRVELCRAIAVVAADILWHEKVWLDSSLTDAEFKSVARIEQILRSQQQRRDQIWQWVGIGALVFLFTGLLNLF